MSDRPWIWARDELALKSYCLLQITGLGWCSCLVPLAQVPCLVLGALVL